MNYRKSVSSSQMMTLVNGKPHHQKNLYVRENVDDKTSFLKHMEVDDHSKSMVGTSYDDKMAVVTRVSDGKRVKYSSNVVKTPNNLKRMLRKSLRLNKKPKGKRLKMTVGKMGKKGKGKRGTQMKKGKRGTQMKKGKRGTQMKKGKRGTQMKKRGTLKRRSTKK